MGKDGYTSSRIYKRNGKDGYTSSRIYKRNGEGWEIISVTRPPQANDSDEGRNRIFRQYAYRDARVA